MSHAKPLEQRLAEGNPGHRPLPVPVVAGGKVDRFQMPETFTKRESAMWDIIVPEIMQLGWIDRVDRQSVVQYVQALTLAEWALRELMKDGKLTTMTARGTPAANPLYRIWNDATKTAVSIGDRFGLTPSARAKLGLTTVRGKSLAADLDDRLGTFDVPETITVEATVVPE